MIKVAAAAENSYSIAEFNAKNAVHLQVMVKDHGVQLRKFDDSVLKAIALISNEVLAEIGKTDPMTTRVYESFVEHRESAIQWSNISERGFLDARSLTQIPGSAA